MFRGVLLLLACVCVDLLILVRLPGRNNPWQFFSVVVVSCFGVGRWIGYWMVRVVRQEAGIGLKIFCRGALTQTETTRKRIVFIVVFPRPPRIA